MMPWNHMLAHSGRASLVVTAMSLVGLFGCAGESPAMFMPGSGNPLDGGTIDDDGQTYVIDLADDNSIGSIQNSRTGEGVSFDGIENGTAVPREVIFGSNGENSFSVDRDTGVVEVSVEAPFVGRQQFTGVVDPASLSIFARGRNATQIDEVDCNTAVSAVDNFCTGFDGSQEQATEELTAIALQLALDAGLPPEFSGFVEDAVATLVNSVDDVCSAWLEMRSGVPGVTEPVDPCDFL